MIRLHQILIFTFLLALQESLAYVQPIYIRYSDEQLRELEANPKPPRIDTPRELIENQYGAQIYYDDILPNENDVILKKTESQNESPTKTGYNENNSNNVHANMPHQNCKNPHGCNIPISSNYYPPHNVRPYSSPDAINDDFTYDYILYAIQYQHYLRELFHDFHRQRQMLLDFIRQQEQQLQQLHFQYNQLNGAISDTEFQMYQVQSMLNHQGPSDTGKETENRQQQISISGTHAEKPSQNMKMGYQQTHH